MQQQPTASNYCENPILNQQTADICTHTHSTNLHQQQQQNFKESMPNSLSSSKISHHSAMNAQSSSNDQTMSHQQAQTQLPQSKINNIKNSSSGNSIKNVGSSNQSNHLGKF